MLHFSYKCQLWQFKMAVELPENAARCPQSYERRCWGWYFFFLRLYTRVLCDKQVNSLRFIIYIIVNCHVVSYCVFAVQCVRICAIKTIFSYCLYNELNFVKVNLPLVWRNKNMCIFAVLLIFYGGCGLFRHWI